MIIAPLSRAAPRWGVLLCGATLAAAPTAAGQSGSRAVPSSVPVYVSGSSAGTAPGTLGELGGMGARLASLEVLRTPPLRVIEAPAPPCTHTPLPADQREEAPSAESFYSIELFSFAQPELLRLSARISRCEGGSLDSVGSHTAVVTSPEALPGLLALTRAAVQTVFDDVPRQNVAIAPLATVGPLPPEPRVARDARQHLETHLWSTTGFEPSDSADLVVEGTLQAAGARRVTARMRAGPRARPQPFLVEGSLDSLPEFYSRLSEAVVDQLIRSSRETNGAHTEDLTSVLAEARLLACLDGGPECVPETGRAAALLRLAVQRDSAHVAAWLLLGRVYLRDGQRTDALVALTRALDLARRAGEASSQRDAANTLGALHASAGNYDQALAMYDLSLRIDAAQPEVATARAWVLGASGRNIELLRAAGNQVTARVDSPTAAAPIQPRPPAVDGNTLATMLRSIPREMVRDSIATIRAICATLGDARAVCGRILYEHAAALYAAGEDPDLVRPVFQAVVALDESDPSRAANAYAYLAASFLGGLSRWHEAAGRRARILTHFEPDSVDHYLRLAETLPRPSLTPSATEWLLRVRGMYRRNRGEFGEARALAREAAGVWPSTAAVLLEAETLYLEGLRLDSLGRHAEGAEAHGRAFALVRDVTDGGGEAAYHLLRVVGQRLRREQEVRSRLESLIAQRSRDVPARRALAYVCEVLEDFQCAYATFAALAGQGRLSGAAERLQAAEYAVLADSLERASVFLDETAAGLDHCRAAVATFYAYWLTAQREGQDDTREAAFERWREAVQGYHDSNSAGCWDFSGAKSRLSRDPHPRDAAHMEEMLDVFNRRR